MVAECLNGLDTSPTGGLNAAHKACARGLGIRRIHNPVSVIDTPENRGMINKISYMLKVEEA